MYKYRCDICNNACIDETKHHLIFRQFENLRKSIVTDKLLKHNDKDAIAIRKHCHNLDHLANIDKISVLGNAMNNYRLSLKESFLIFNLKPSLSLAKESIPLYLFDNDSEHC